LESKKRAAAATKMDKKRQRKCSHGKSNGIEIIEPFRNGVHFARNDDDGMDEGSLPFA